MRYINLHLHYITHYITRVLVSRRLEDKNESLGLGLEHLVLVSVLKKKILQFFFKTFVVILDGSGQGTPWHFVRDKLSSLPFGSHSLREPSALNAHQPQLRGYLTLGILLGYTDASKAQCIDCGKLLSLGSNKPGKQTVHGLKCHRKMPQRYQSIHCT